MSAVTTIEEPVKELTGHDLAGEGELFTLLNGEQVRLVFTMHTFMVIEREFGDISKLEELFNGPDMLKVVATLIEASVQGASVSGDELFKNIPISQFSGIMSSLIGAMPQDLEQPQVMNRQQRRKTQSSPGANSTTSHVSRSASPRPTSGK